jgi:hypothetical protein
MQVSMASENRPTILRWALACSAICLAVCLRHTYSYNVEPGYWTIWWAGMSICIGTVLYFIWRAIRRGLK